MADHLRLGLQGVEDVLIAANGLEPSSEVKKAFRSRLGHLQRSGFPAAAKVGRFARASYGLDELLQLSFVFALVQAYVPPVIGRRVVADFWPEIARLFLAALREAHFSESDYVPRGAPFIMNLLPRALEGLGNEAREDGKGGVDQGTYEIRLDRGRPDGDAADDEFASEASRATAVAATISVDFRTLTANLTSALGEPRRSALEASVADLAARHGWKR